MPEKLRLLLAALLASITLSVPAVRPAAADATPQSLPFSQSWGNAGLITANDNWTGVPGIQGFLGDDGSTTTAGIDPQTILAPFTTLDVIANQSNPNITNGGVAEFDGITDRTVALQGSGAADAPHLILYLNTTGASGVTVAYNLRDIDASADNTNQQVALQFRIGSTGNFTNVPAGYVADATTGPSLATLVTPVCVVLPAAANNQPEVQVRVLTTNAPSNDEWVGVDDVVVNTAGCGGGGVTLSIDDASVLEGDSGTTTASFTVSLSGPAPAGGVTFAVCTDDDSATVADGDYDTNCLTGQTIAEGDDTFPFDVTVNGDTDVEPNETFFVDVTNVTGATVADGRGVGTITNDDVTLVAIHDVQGNGTSSPITGAAVTTRGIVTGVKSNGFFIQEPDATVDADPATSEGVFVFTSSAPPAAAAVGNLVQVTGTVVEFVPSQDPFQPPLTEIGGSPTVSVVSPGQPLPAPVALTPTFPDPAGPFDQLERLEGMRVSVASLTVVGPTLGNVNEANATATSTGVFFGVVTGVPRPFREPGIQAPDPAPSGSIPPIPRFDTNPERIRVDSDGLTGGPLLDVGTGAVVTGLVGPLDYTFRTYTILPDPSPGPSIAGGPTPTAVPTPDGDEVTVGAFNVQRFFDTVNDPGIGEPVLTATAYDNRLKKASLAIRDFLRSPDVLGVVEVENLDALQDLAARISADALAAAQPDPQYVAFLEEGNDPGGIDVGFLVKTAEVAAGTPRVTVNAVVQEGAAATFINPNDGQPDLLNDRPPLRLDAEVNHPNGAAFPLTVIVNHLRSLNGVDDPTPNGSGTEGTRVRAKRKAQADFLANLVEARQTADPDELIVLVGDFNAFEFNDGYVDLMGIVQGTPAPAAETVLPGSDLVDPDLVNLASTAPAAERYSFVFDGSAQSLDHVVVNAALVAATTARRLEHSRIDADFPATARNDTTNAVRLADHDPLIGYFEVAAFAVADLTITKDDAPDPVDAGELLVYTIAVENAGPDAAQSVSLTDTLPDDTTFHSLTEPGGWSCDTPMAGDDGMVTCTRSSLDPGTASFTLTVRVDAGVANGTVLSNTATVSSTTGDPDGDLSATATTTVRRPGVTVTPTAGLITTEAGGQATFTVVLDAEPTADVTIGLTSNDTSEGTVTPPSLTFTTGDWDTPQTVTVTGVDDLLADGDILYAIVTAAATSTDTGYDGLDAADAAVTNLDDAAEGTFYTIAPCRLLDTRVNGPVLSSDVEALVVVHGACGIPATAKAVAINVTVTQPTDAGHLTLYSGDLPEPEASTINFGADQTRANNAIVTLAGDGSGTFAVSPFVLGNGTVHLIVDVSGYFE